MTAAAQFTAAPEATWVTFDAPPAAAAFRVDVAKRTISGQIVPWGAIGENSAGKWRFPEGSLYWSDPGRVKLNRDHDRARAVGRGERIVSTGAGVDAAFKIKRGPEGDDALMSAEDGVDDGFSIEIHFGPGDGWEPDPADRTVRVVKRAQLRGVAQLAMPAFDDARVAAVAFAQQQEEHMTGSTTKVDDKGGPADGSAFDFDGYMKGLGDTIAESHKNLTTELGASIGESITAGVTAALENLSAPQEGPQPVKAARFKVTREAPVYAFNGLGFSLVRDAWHAGRERDEDAIERLRKYRAQTEEMAKLAQQFVAWQSFAPIGTSAASEIIPPGYRPDLYVPELMKGRPMVSACSRGTIANATPFTVPVFTSASGATADHVEGTNPSDGSLNLDTKTVTPGAISGRLVLTREIVDSSNPAIDQIALAAMRESYNQQTEGKVYTLLNGANGVGGTITNGFVPSGAQAATVNVGTDVDVQGALLVRALRRALAAYPFRRFGAPTNALLNQPATTYLADAVDTTGRPLLPSIGAQNASGLGNAVSQGWSVDGLAHEPAWAMTGAAAGDAQVITLNQADAWVWESPLLTFRFEEKQGPANIELNLFAYFGAHVLRPVGLSGMRITAS